jgi:hypothetical protein
VIALALPMPAAAEDLEARVERLAGFDRGDGDGIFKTFGKRALNRTRRSLSLGPYVGVSPGFGTENDGEFALDLEFGLALLRYDIPVIPSASRIKDIIVGVVKDRLKDQVKAALSRGENPTDADIKEWGREIRDRVVDEFLLKLRPKKLEDPSFQLRAGIDRLFGEDAWNLRAGVGIGIGPVYFNGGVGVSLADSAEGLAYLGLSIPILLSDGLRSPVVEPFVRFDAFTGEDEGLSDQILFGARFMLDVI